MSNPDQKEQQTIIKGYLKGEARDFFIVTNWIEKVVNHYSWGLGAYKEDIIQDVRIKIYVNLKENKFRKASQLKTYVYRIAKFTCIDFLRKSRTKATDNIDTLDLKEDRDALSILILKEKDNVVQTVLEEIADTCKEILQLVFIEKLSYKEISVILNIAVGTVKSRVFRCIEKAVALKDKYWNDSETNTTMK